MCACARGRPKVARVFTQGPGERGSEGTEGQGAP